MIPALTARLKELGQRGPYRWGLLFHYKKELNLTDYGVEVLIRWSMIKNQSLEWPVDYYGSSRSPRVHYSRKRPNLFIKTQYEYHGDYR
jgi:hypothetical protein